MKPNFSNPVKTSLIIVAMLALSGLSVCGLTGCSLFGSVPWEQFVNEITPPTNRVLQAGKNRDTQAATLEFERPSEATSTVKALFDSRRDVFDTVVLLNEREDEHFASVSQGVNSATIEVRVTYKNNRTALFKFFAVRTLSAWKFRTVEIAP
jgi:hypothetical protein